MELQRPTVLPRPLDALAADTVEVDAAIALVRRGVAVRVRLASLRNAKAVAQIAVVHAQLAGVAFSTQRDGSSLTLTLGPRDRRERHPA
jgi:hypothetical protein